MALRQQAEALLELRETLLTLKSEATCESNWRTNLDVRRENRAARDDILEPVMNVWTGEVPPGQPRTVLALYDLPLAEAQDLLRQLGVDFDVHSGLDATSALLNWEMRGGRHPAGPTLVEERALVRERAPRPEPAHELLERVEELRRLEARQQQQPGQQGQAQQQQQADDDAREGEAEQDDGHEHENVEAQAGEAEQEDGNERDGEMVMEE